MLIRFFNNVFSEPKGAELAKAIKAMPVQLATVVNKDVTGGEYSENRKGGVIWNPPAEVLAELDKTLAICAKKIGIKTTHRTGFHILRYGKEGKFSPHQDWMPKTLNNRRFTVIIGIQKARKGGETAFPNKPELKPYRLDAGDVLIWENGRGSVNFNEAMHESKPVIEGEKMVAVAWIHEGAMTNENDKGHGLLPTFLSQEERTIALNEILRAKLEPGKDGGMEGGWMPYAEKLLREKTAYMEAVTGFKLQAANSFARIYPANASALPPHTDRAELDVTVSVTLAKGFDNNFCICGADGKTVAYDANPGDGVFVRGNRLAHHREDIKGEPGKQLICLFLHWTILVENA